jgi:hypothetical protein
MKEFEILSLLFVMVRFLTGVSWAYSPHIKQDEPSEDIQVCAQLLFLKLRQTKTLAPCNFRFLS